MQLRAERADLATAAQRELVLLTTAIRGSVENAVRDAQQTDVTILLEQLELKDPAVDVFIFEPHGALLGSSRGSAANDQLARNLVRSNGDGDALRVQELDSGALAGVAPLRDRGVLVGQLVILRPATVLSNDLRQERRAIVLSIVLVIASLSIVILVVMRLSLHRPLDRVIAGVRRVRAGDLSVRIGLEGKNEFAELAREFDNLTVTLERTRQELAREAERRAQLESAMQRANRLAVVGELAATLAHEIGSPLQVLNGRARELEARQDLPESAHRSAAIMVQQTDRVHGIIERLLNVARRKAPIVVQFDVRESVLQVIELLSTQARHAAVGLETAIADVRPVSGDPAQVQQVLLNLLQNALRASERGTVIRVVVSSSPFVPCTASLPRSSVVISVEDQGIGIPEELHDQVFEPFFTAWSSDTGASGTGLGLAVVRSIVRDHGGAVSLTRGSDGLGSRFIVHLPAAPRAIPSQTELM
jgi:signal transduction histidine kinase